MGRPLVDLTGKQFGRLTVISRGDSGPGRSFWLCRCECGTKKQVAANALKAGYARSCGCLNAELASARSAKDKRTHGQSRTPLYIVWQTMKRRCHEQHNHAYKNYGGRGIYVCEEWRRFEEFYDWALRSGYRHGLSIDRIDNDGPYCPENCRWATPKVQANNRRNSIRITWQGKTKTIRGWSDETGLPCSTIRQRLASGWPIAKALTQPRRKR